MKFMDFLKPGASKQSESGADDQVNQSAPEEEKLEEEREIVSSATKIKIVAALMVVGFATYIAYWVQEPSQLRADVLAPQETMQASVTDETALVAQAPETSGFTQEVSIVDFTFDPATVTVEKGTTVVWTNKDSVPHTVTATSFSSGTLNAGDSFSYTFNEDGEFEYTCSFHPQMKGTVLAGQVPAGTVETMAETMEPLTQAEDTLAPAAGENPSLETEVILPTDAPTVTFNPEILMNEAMPSNLDAAIAAAQATAVLNAAALENANTDLAESGPEDFLYVGIFGVILYLNRKRLKLAGVLK